MASPGNQHCAICIGTVSFPILDRRWLFACAAVASVPSRQRNIVLPSRWLTQMTTKPPLEVAPTTCVSFYRLIQFCTIALYHCDEADDHCVARDLTSSSAAICPSVCLSVRPSVCLSVRLSHCVARALMNLSFAFCNDSRPSAAYVTTPWTSDSAPSPSVLASGESVWVYVTTPCMSRTRTRCYRPAHTEKPRADSHCIQSCPSVHSVWPDPTQPISWLAQPNPLQVEKFGPNPTRPTTTNNGVVRYFYTQNLARTFGQPSIKLFMFFTDHYTQQQCHYVTQKQALQRNV